MVNSFRFFIGLFLVLLTGCKTNEIYDKTYAVSSDGWNYDQILEFKFPVPDISKPYDLYLQIRNSDTYSYSNIWLFVKTFAPNGSVLNDTLEIVLADKTGNWLGKGIGNVNEMQVPYKQHVYFVNRGIFKVSIQHAMRDTCLEGIMDLGFRLQYHN